METQKDKFQLEENARYINCAYMSPLLKSVEEKGIEGMIRKRNPFTIKQDHYFDEVALLREKFAQLIHGKASQVALVPSVSYGLACAVKNIPYQTGQKVILIEGEFPSGYLTAEKWCSLNGAELQIVSPESGYEQRGKNWNEKLLHAIDDRTAFVLISSVHWMDGTRFDLKKIGEKCRKHGAKFLVDGTQSVGAQALDIEESGIDVLCCAGYKWLMGPYSQAYAYFGTSMLQGEPLEESWMNRTNALDFAKLANYGKEYFPGATRFNVGQTSDFMKMPMCNEALSQILEWGVGNIEDYCVEILKPLVDHLEQCGLHFEEDEWRGSHLLGFYLPEGSNTEKLLHGLQQEQIYLSLRGNAIRVSPNVYNTSEDIQVLIHTLRQNL